MFSFCLNVNASTNTYDRTETQNYGVNKKWKITNKNKNNVLNTPLVDASEKVYDFADILSDSEEKYLKTKIDSFIEETNMDLVILTVNFPYTNAKENENYAADFYDYNDFGIDFDKYDGILLLRNAYSADPYYDMYMFGEAQLYYNEDRCDNILDSIFSNMKSGIYLNAMESFINRLKTYYNSGIPSDMADYYVDDMGYLRRRYIFPWTVAILVAGIGTAIIMYNLVNKNKMIRKAVQASDYLDKTSITYSIRQDVLIGSHTTHYTVSSSSGGSGGGGSHHSSSGSSGGGHSSGGGRHG